MSRMIKCVLLVLVASAAQAQMAHEVLLLVNKNSKASMRVANTYTELRQIPALNIVYLDIPESAYGGSATITPEEFTKLIWEPANAVARERGIEDQILAWIYSVDFPIRVKTDPYDRKQMSVGGVTFLRNEIPDLTMVEEGTYQSLLFGGPNSRMKVKIVPLSLLLHKEGLGLDAIGVPQGLEYLKRGFGDKMPLPSMMLGYIGEKGSTLETVLKCLHTGASSDRKGLRTGFYFVQSEDVRSTCREWQFYPTVSVLNNRRINAVVTTNFPSGAENVMGLMMGAEKVDPSAIKSFAPGAMAEHLTSWSAEFQKPQTKATSWIDAGATATAGSVVEPYSNFDKFPSARFFEYYTYGCTMLESFYQTIASPLQILLLGDPLAVPYSRPTRVQLLGANKMEQDFTYFAKAESRVPNVTFLYTFLLDGKVIRDFTDDPTMYLRAIKLADGYHELRVVACHEFQVLYTATAVKPFVVDLYGRSLAIQPDIQRLDDFRHTIKTAIGGTEQPEKLRLISGVRVLDEASYGADAELVLDERVIGEGPNSIRAVAIYADGMEVSSAPFKFEIKFRAEP
jgi:hypothetical protein